MAARLAPDPTRGVFTTLLVVRGAPVVLERHLRRLGASAAELYGAVVPPQAAARAAHAARPLALGRLRLELRPAPVAAGVALEVTARPVDAAVLLPAWAGAIDLRSTVVADWRGGHKWRDRRLLEGLEHDCAPACPLLLDAHGAVLETTRANVFAVDARGTLRTPPLDGRILPGVARAELIAVARELGVPVREAPLSLTQARAAGELLATGSIRGVERVRSLDGDALPGPGPVGTALERALRERWLGGAADPLPSSA